MCGWCYLNNTWQRRLKKSFLVCEAAAALLMMARGNGRRRASPTRSEMTTIVVFFSLFFSVCPFSLSLCVCIPSPSQPRSTGQRFGSARDMLAKRKVMVFTTAAPQCWQPALPKWHTLFGFPTFIQIPSTPSLSKSTPHTQKTRTLHQPQSCRSRRTTDIPSSHFYFTPQKARIWWFK